MNTMSVVAKGEKSIRSDWFGFSNREHILG